MKVGITTLGADGGLSGISQYLRNLLEQFTTLGREDHFEVVVFEDEENFFIPPCENVTAHRIHKIFRGPVAGIAWHQAVLPLLCHQRNDDVLFLPAANRRLPVAVPCPTVGTVHDFSSLHVDDKYDSGRMFYIKRVLPTLIRQLDAVVTVSESSKRDIVEFAKVEDQRVLVTPLAADTSRYFTRDSDQSKNYVAKKYGIRSPYILYISRIEHPGKNHVRLIRAFECFKARTGLPHQLVLAGSDRERSEYVHQAASRSSFRSEIRFTGFAPDEDLPELYSGADLFVFPSLYEGFGLPVLEAMACGVPVACSNVSSMPEVAGQAALLFDPLQTDSISAALIDILESPGARQRYSASGLQRAGQFHWRVTAQKTLDLLRATAVGPCG